MEDSFDYRDEAAQNGEQEIDKVLRPKTLSDFAGQPTAVENLEVFVRDLTIASYASKESEAVFWSFLLGLIIF